MTLNSHICRIIIKSIKITRNNLFRRIVLITIFTKSQINFVPSRAHVKSEMRAHHSLQAISTMGSSPRMELNKFYVIERFSRNDLMFMSTRIFRGLMKGNNGTLIENPAFFNNIFDSSSEYSFRWLSPA